jgi:hypothetical protein
MTASCKTIHSSSRITRGAIMSDQPNINKTTAYLSATGVLAVASFVLVTPLWVTLPILAVAAVPVAMNPNRKEMFEKIGEDMKSIWEDVKVYGKQDIKAVKNWWDNFSFKQAIAPKTADVPAATEAKSTFNADATSKNDFGANAKPGVEAAVEKAPEVKKAVPAAKPNAPK